MQMEEQEVAVPIDLFNRFVVKSEYVNSFLKTWTKDAALKKQQLWNQTNMEYSSRSYSEYVL